MDVEYVLTNRFFTRACMVLATSVIGWLIGFGTVRLANSTNSTPRVNAVVTQAPVVQTPQSIGANLTATTEALETATPVEHATSEAILVADPTNVADTTTPPPAVTEAPATPTAPDVESTAFATAQVTPESTTPPSAIELASSTTASTTVVELMCIVTSDNGLLVRSGPRLDFEQIGNLSVGSRIMARGRSENNWLLIVSPEVAEGWINATFVSCSGTVDVLPIVTPVPTQ